MMNLSDILVIMTILCNFIYNTISMILNITILKRNINPIQINNHDTSAFQNKESAVSSSPEVVNTNRGLFNPD